MAVRMQAGKVRTAPAVRSAKQGGFTYIALLCALALLSLATHSVMEVVSQQAQREREEALLRTGATYMRAIASYYHATPGAVKRWPLTLEDLLEDKRLVQIRRHLREIYPDPLTRNADWDLVLAPDGGIQGVRSRSTQSPIRVGTVQAEGVTLPAARRYSDWAFVYQPDLDGQTPTTRQGQP